VAVQRCFIQGQNDHEKRLNMQMRAEINSVFCWDRISFLHQCYSVHEDYPPLKPLKGRWASVRAEAWRLAKNRCEIEVLLGAKIAFNQKLSLDPRSSIDSFLICKHQIHRKDYEAYLCSLKNHIHSQLFKTENVKKEVQGDCKLALPGTQREWFVKDLAVQSWKANPCANCQQSYEYYQLRCPPKKLLGRERWEQIVRKYKLDPRKPNEKIRGRGKKTLQN
jgi:hypothetical protein